MKKEALLYDKLDKGFVECKLCAHHCKLAVDKLGLCRVRQNLEGALYTYTYGDVAAVHVDPIEKKPLYHFLPGTRSFSIATRGCNFRCGFCQNWEISQDTFRINMNERIAVPPEEVIKEALMSKCQSISYTYTEPTIFFEYALDIAKLAKEKGLANIFVTNGFMTKEAGQMIWPYLNAANIDLKSFSDDFYQKQCQGKLQPVLDTIALLRKLGVWIEVTTLIIPGANDSEQELKNIASFLADTDKNMPWHISRFFPNYKYTRIQPTPEGTLKKAEELGRKAGIRYIYAGNISGWGSDTLCHNCGKALIKREGYNITENRISQNNCSYCNSQIPGVFS